MDTKNIFPENLSKGGMIGGIVGAIASVKFHKEEDKMITKAAKTGVFAGLGFLLGSFAERIFRKFASRSQNGEGNPSGNGEMCHESSGLYHDNVLFM